jgi:cellulose synthase (UDP-forming)
MIALLEFSVLRYFVWRATDTLPTFEPILASLWQWLFFGVEALSTVFLCWTSLVLVRRSDLAPLADVRERELRARPTKPRVTVLIPTMNEPYHVLEATIRAAAAIDYPNFEVCVLDDDKGPKPAAAARRNLLARVVDWLL